MKKQKIKRIITLLLVAVFCMSIFAGCSLFVYDEKADMGQVIVEIKSVDAEYQLPIYEDYLDTNDNPVFEVNNDRTSADFGKVTTKRVQAVKRTHSGESIKKAKMQGAEILYLGYENYDNTKSEQPTDLGKAVEVLSSDKRALREKTSSGYFVDAKSGEEFKYLGVISPEQLALWQSEDTDELYYSRTYFDDVEKTDASLDAGKKSAYSNDLPTVYYDSSAKETENYYFYEMTPIAEKGIFATPSYNTFKEAMINYFQSYFTSYMDEKQYTAEEAFEEICGNTTTVYLSYIEAAKSIHAGDTEWGVTEQNDVNKKLYENVDSHLNSIYLQIAGDFGKTYPSFTFKSDDSDTTYPTKPEQTEAEAVKDYKVWHITQEAGRLPGSGSNANVSSLEREAIKRFVESISDTIDSTYAMTKEEREEFESELKEMREQIKTNAGAEALYAKLYTFKCIQKIFVESYELTTKLDAFRAYLLRDVKITAEDVNKSYTDMLASQKASFNANPAGYHSAAKDNQVVLYFKDNEYFWVKHILLPFSDEDTAKLAEYKKYHTDEEVQEYRRRLSESMQVYRHINGENDTANPISLSAAYSNINAEMSAVYADNYLAERKFNDLIYDYNTDPGIFESEMGYAVTKTPAARGGAAESYMIEFATEARALLGAYMAGKSLYDFKSDSTDYQINAYDQLNKNMIVKQGSISGPVLTDYGAHIMYLCYVPSVGHVRQLSEYLTPGRYTTIYDQVSGDYLETLQNNSFASWQSQIKAKYKELGNIVNYQSRFQDQINKFEELYKENKKAQSE